MVNLLMGLALGLSVLSAAAVWVNVQWQIDRQTLLRSHTQQDVRALLDTLVHDIRRADFQGTQLSALQSNSGLCESPFCGLPEDFELSSHQILFSLDRNDNGVKDNNDCSGFRLNAKELQTKTACRPVVWSTLSDNKNLQILALDFRYQCNNVSGNAIDAATHGDLVSIVLRSQSVSEKVPSTFQRLVRLRNLGKLNRSGSQVCTDLET